MPTLRNIRRCTIGRVPDLKRITVEDFKSEDRDLVQKLAFIINSFHEQVRNVLNQSVDFDNLAQELQTINFTTNSSGQPLNTVKFRSNLVNRIKGILPVRVVITSSNTRYATQLPVITWSQNGQQITIVNIGGLEPETGYELTLLTL